MTGILSGLVSRTGVLFGVTGKCSPQEFSLAITDKSSSQFRFLDYLSFSPFLLFASLVIRYFTFYIIMHCFKRKLQNWLIMSTYCLRLLLLLYLLLLK